MIQIKRTNTQKREQIAERLKSEPALSNRAVSRQLNVSPHTVADVRKLLNIERPSSCVNAQGGTDSYNWLKHPWIQANPHIIDTIRSPRALRAIKSSPEVIQIMKERNVGAVRAQQLINLQRKAEVKKANRIDIAAKDIVIKEDDIKTGLRWIPDSSCDIVCVDPPYGKDYINLYEDISRVSNRILKPNGHLLVMTGCYHLPYIMESLVKGANKSTLRYKWTMTVLLPRSSPTSLMLKGIMTGWKPVIVFKKRGPKVSNPALVYDVITATDNDDKSLHKWQQSEKVFCELLSRFDHSVVADICCGSGTSITSAIKVGATKVYACDNDTKSVETTRKRIKEVLYSNKE